MDESVNRKKILIGLNQIIDYLGISKSLFYDFVQKGMPARIINNRWYAHKENLDDYFKQITHFHEKTIPEDAE